MPSIGGMTPGAIQYVNNPLQSPQLQSSSIQGSPSQHSPMSQTQVSTKSNHASGDQTTQVKSILKFITCYNNLLKFTY